MAYSNVERYLRVMQAFQDGDPAEMAGMLASDVLWHEAGNPQVYRGKETVAARVAGLAAGSTAQVTLHTVLGDDDNLVCVGRANFDRAGGHVAYPYVEHMKLKDGFITERWSYMDAVPDDVKAFFAP